MTIIIAVAIQANGTATLKRNCIAEGRIGSYWIAPYVFYESVKVGPKVSARVIYYDKSGNIVREMEGNLNTLPGYIIEYKQRKKTFFPVFGDWKLSISTGRNSRLFTARNSPFLAHWDGSSFTIYNKGKISGHVEVSPEVIRSVKFSDLGYMGITHRNENHEMTLSFYNNRCELIWSRLYDKSHVPEVVSVNTEGMLISEYRSVAYWDKGGRQCTIPEVDAVLSWIEARKSILFVGRKDNTFYLSLVKYPSGEFVWSTRIPTEEQIGGGIRAGVYGDLVMCCWFEYVTIESLEMIGLGNHYIAAFDFDTGDYLTACTTASRLPSYDHSAFVEHEGEYFYLDNEVLVEIDSLDVRNRKNQWR